MSLSTKYVMTALFFEEFNTVAGVIADDNCDDEEFIVDFIVVVFNSGVVSVDCDSGSWRSNTLRSSSTVIVSVVDGGRFDCGCIRPMLVSTWKLSRQSDTSVLHGITCSHWTPSGLYETLFAGGTLKKQQQQNYTTELYSKTNRVQPSWSQKKISCNQMTGEINKPGWLERV